VPCKWVLKTLQSHKKSYKDFFMSLSLSFHDGLAQLRALGEPTRLRIALLLLQGELSVSDFVDILAQSQPRLSRHLKLMQEAGLITRSAEGAYAYYRLRDTAFLRNHLLSYSENDPILEADKARLALVRLERETKANSYFARNAQDWDRLRALHISENLVEEAIVKALNDRPISKLLDLGTGTGRMLSLLKNTYLEAIGLDRNSAMLNVARAQLAREGITHAALKQGDVYALDFVPQSFDCVLVHQVLHFLEDAQKAIEQAALVLKPKGRLLIVDFAPHTQEFLRESQSHRRLGFAQETIETYFTHFGLKPISFTPLSTHNENQLSVCLWLAEKE
jgi:ubiquinone/menaquinone biosynthesis C-methylase UbiE